METPRKFVIAIVNLRGVSTKLNKYIVFTMQTYKKLIRLRARDFYEVIVDEGEALNFYRINFYLMEIESE